jgi:hypothetical protein
MELTKTTTLDKLEIDMVSGAVSIRENTVIVDDGKQVASNYHRSSYMPGDDLAPLPSKVAKWIEHIWANL